MAEEERLTKRERRERSREERRRKEAEAASKQRRQRLMTTLLTLVVVAAIAGIVATALLGGTDEIAETVVLGQSDIESAEQAAECDVLVDNQPLEDRTHLDAGSAPPADALYGEIRPTHSGPHFGQFHPVLSAADTQLEERALTHNLEHGSVVAWYDPEQVDGDTISAMEGWADTLNESGFQFSRTGASIFVAPYTDPGISSGKAIAFRAWGWAMDCNSWDETVANGVVLDHFGSHGIGPERFLAPFPEDTLEYDPDDAPAGFAGDEAPSDQDPGGGAPDPDSMTPDDEATDEASEPTEDETADDSTADDS